MRVNLNPKVSLVGNEVHDAAFAGCIYDQVNDVRLLVLLAL